MLPNRSQAEKESLALQRYTVAGPDKMPTGRLRSISASCSISSSSLQPGAPV